MDQLGDEKQKRTSSWVEELALKEGMKRLNDREKMIIRKRFFKEKHKWKLQKKLGFLKRKCHV